MTDEWLEQEQLHFAVQDGDLDRVKTLLQQGRDVNQFDELSLTPLHYAARGEQLVIARLLLEAGAEVNAQETRKIGETPLGEVAGSCSFEMAELLIRAGANPKISGWMQQTPLDRASRRKKPEGRRVYELLLAAGTKFGA